MSASKRKTWRYLARDPHSSYRQLSVKGRRIRATSLYDLTVAPEEPMTPEQVAQDYQVPLEAVLEAIAYCKSNPPEIEEDFRMEEEAHKTAQSLLADIKKSIAAKKRPRAS